MYSKKAQGWTKHFDFILLDILSLQIAFVLAYMSRHGFVSPYSNAEYVNLAIVCILVDFAVLIGNKSLKGQKLIREGAERKRYLPAFLVL